MEQLDLVQRAQRGDRDAFDLLLADALSRLFAIARLILRDSDMAEDAVQDALVHCWRDLPRLREPARFDAWLHRLLVNAVADQARRHRTLRVRVALIEIEDATSDPASGLADRDQVRRGFEHLKVEHRTILVLHHYLGMGSQEAAAVLGIPAGTAASRLHYATEAMRAALEADARVVPLQEVSA